MEYPDAWYHVMNRGRRGEAVFIDNRDYDAFMKLLQESTELWRIRIAAYCLMSNHYHLLVQTPCANLSRAMRHIDGIYTQRYNRRHKTVGQVFAGRYKSIIIDADTYLLDVVRYIHKNPVRAGMVDQIQRYPWTSHPGYLADTPEWDWLHKGFVLSTFSFDRNEAKRRYKRFITDNDSEEITRFFDGKNVHAILGTDRFIRWIRERSLDRRGDKEIPESKFLLPSVEDVMDVVCAAYNIDREALLTSKRGVTNEARNVAIYLSRWLCGERLGDIGKQFRLTGYSSVSNVVGCMKKEEEKGGAVKGRIESVKAKIRKSQMKT